MFFVRAVFLLVFQHVQRAYYDRPCLFRLNNLFNHGMFCRLIGGSKLSHILIFLLLFQIGGLIPEYNIRRTVSSHHGNLKLYF